MRPPGTDESSSRLQVWLADLERLHDKLENVEAAYRLLAAEESAWAAAGRPEVQRHRRLARITLRVLLARAGVGSARGQSLTADSHGKPRLGPGEPAFNVSHSSGFALIAIAARGPIGIDLEHERSVQLGETRRALVIAAANGLGGRAAIADDAASGFATFLHAWTRLEAFAKARGSGVGQLLTDLGVTASGVRHHSPDDVARSAAVIRAASHLDVAALPLPIGLFGAVCAPIGSIPHGVGVHCLTSGECRLDGASTLSS